MKKSSMKASMVIKPRKPSRVTLILVFGLVMAIVALNVASYFLS